MTTTTTTVQATTSRPRQDSVDALSFGTVLSTSDDSDSDDERRLAKQKTVVDLSEGNGPVSTDSVFH